MTNQNKILYWAPRIICIGAILFVSLFALDAFDSEQTVWQQIGGFLIHLIPSFVLLGLLILSWKYEYLGGILFIVLGLIFSYFIFKSNYNNNQSVWISLGIIASITFPFIIAGVLFVAHHWQTNKKSQKN